MIFKVRIGHWRITFTIAPVIDVKGVNSTLQDGNHIPMWDFDNIPLEKVAHVLEIVQYVYNLPTIFILNSGKPNHFIAYCFKRLPWDLCKLVVATARYVDPNFFKYGVYRDHWTLRVTPKESGIPHCVEVIKSPVQEDCNVRDLKSWTQYETLADNTPMRKREWNFAKR